MAPGMVSRQWKLHGRSSCRQGVWLGPTTIFTSSKFHDTHTSRQRQSIIFCPPQSPSREEMVGNMLDQPSKMSTVQIPPMPTRLVDVGPPDGSRSPRICTPYVRSRYLTLSHCWGSYQIATTTKANFNGRCKAISMETISKTFQDVIKATREFRM
ncbi:hypothetical protein BKA65DRAFT_243877 [Rhexocercosporidium sp. MPI-PUGE-AT-0058]|nr:hypothetical protein BKA65DRAFT_243877 [Rhexocercosporidium sp. MPI-PUGE-AT-0058]